MIGSRSLVELATLFLAKFGALIVGVVFLPIYSRQMGADAFGMVAVILSAQAFAILADCGMATLVSRDMSQGFNNTAFASNTLPLAESAVTLVYVALLCLAVPTSIFGKSQLSPASIAACVLFIYFTLIQNINQTALLARKQFISASIIQLVGVTLRAAATTAVVCYWNNSVEAFIWTQLWCTAAHAAVTRWRWSYSNKAATTIAVQPPFRFCDTFKLLRRGFPVLVSGLAGAAVLQLDKPIISAFASSAEVAPYFLAASFSILPTSLLAAPIVQYFQPRIFTLIEARDDTSQATSTIRTFTYLLFAIVGLPTFAIWIWCPEIIAIWLHGSSHIPQVVHYSRILLPAFALGSLSYVPVILLLAVQDFRYQAATAIIFSSSTLFLVAFAAFKRRTDWACFAYLTYFAAASISVWLRSLSFNPIKQLAKIGARSAFKPLLSLAALALGTLILSR